MTKPTSARYYASQVLLAVIESGRALEKAEADCAIPAPAGKDRALSRALIYGVLRNHFRLREILAQLLQKPLKSRDQDIVIVLMMALFQLLEHRSPNYAVVSESVNTVEMLGKSWAKRLVNGVLRNFLRQQDALMATALENTAAKWNAPHWFIEQLQQDWPEHWPTILQANQCQAPMILRVNLARITREDYLELLQDADLKAAPVDLVASAVKLLQACDVEQLPGFGRGLVSVQDTAAQWAAYLLNPQPGERILDACAAPGGKTLHLLERQPQLSSLDALDCDAQRVGKIQENLARLAPTVNSLQVKIADASELSQWWDGRPYDRVLLDVPCSGTGVIRRHPDIQLHRRPADIPAFQQQQKQLLDRLWQTLKPGGRLLYCTCSILNAENETVILDFLSTHADAKLESLQLPAVCHAQAGAQLLPGVTDHDGFYYAMLCKQAL